MWWLAGWRTPPLVDQIYIFSYPHVYIDVSGSRCACVCVFLYVGWRCAFDTVEQIANNTWPIIMYDDDDDDDFTVVVVIVGDYNILIYIPYFVYLFKYIHL